MFKLSAGLKLMMGKKDLSFVSLEMRAQIQTASNYKDVFHVTFKSVTCTLSTAFIINMACKPP